jgi:flagellar motility protein MotE (MotC chaperone)
MKSQLLIAIFCGVAGGSLVPVWHGTWLPVERPLVATSAQAAEPGPASSKPAVAPGVGSTTAVSKPASPLAATAASAPVLIEQMRQHFPSDRAFDPLDLSPERIRILEQAFQLVMTLRARDVELSAREKAVETARHELEARMRLFESDIATAREGYRDSIRKELAERERTVEAKLELIKQQEEALNRVKAQLRRDVGEQFDKIIGVYQGMKPKRAARVLEERDPADIAAIMFLLPDDQRTKILSEMDPALVGTVLKGPFAEELDAARPARNGRPPARQ